MLLVTSYPFTDTLAGCVVICEIAFHIILNPSLDEDIVQTIIAILNRGGAPKPPASHLLAMLYLGDDKAQRRPCPQVSEKVKKCSLPEKNLENHFHCALASVLSEN